MARINSKQILDEYLKHCKRQNKTYKTIENYKSVINIFKDFLTKQNNDFLSGDDNKEIFEKFLDYLGEERDISYSRKKIYFSALAHFYDFLEYYGYIKKNVVLNVRRMYLRQFKKDYTPQRRKSITIEEIG